MNFPRDPVSNVRRFMQGRGLATVRYASYDHCYNYFQKHREAGEIPTLANKDARELSCLHLGYFLASWGMFRGKAALLQCSSAALLPAIELISQASDSIWMTDVEHYTDERIEELLDFKAALGAVVPGGRSGTLTSKIMLGVFGCVPAFDRFFCNGFGTSGFRRQALHDLHTYYTRHHEVIESCREMTIDFDGRDTKRRYTQAKVIDMIFFVEGGGT